MKRSSIALGLAGSLVLAGLLLAPSRDLRAAGPSSLGPRPAEAAGVRPASPASEGRLPVPRRSALATASPFCESAATPLEVVLSVRDGFGAPVEGAELLFAAVHDGLRPAARTDARGTAWARLDAPPEGLWIGVRYQGRVRGALRRVSGSSTSTVHLAWSLRPERLWRGGGAGREPWTRVRGARLAEESPPRQARKAHGDEFLNEHAAPATDPPELLYSPTDGGTADRGARLPARVAGRVRGLGGGLLAGARVEAHSALGGELRQTTTDSTGAYVLEDLHGGRWSLRAEHERWGAGQRTVELVPGETTAWDPLLDARASLRGRLVDSGGRPLADWIVEARSSDGHTAGSAWTDGAGYFVIPALAGVAHDLRVHAAGSGGALSLLVEEATWPGGATMLLRLEREGPPHAELSVETPVETREARLIWLASGEALTLETRDAGRRFEARRLPRGSYELVLFEVGSEAPRVHFVELGRDEARRLSFAPR